MGTPSMMKDRFDDSVEIDEYEEVMPAKKTSYSGSTSGYIDKK